MSSDSKARGAHIIVVGNEKGGSGKSTTAIHVAVALMQRGMSVATLDVDARQGTLSRYLANRHAFIKAAGVDHVRMPDHYAVEAAPAGADADVETELDRLGLMIEGATINHDVVVIDTPGSASNLSALAHSYADTLITPINDSFVDLDVLAHVDGRRMAVMGPSHYAEMVWEQKKVRARRDGGSIDWMVMRNRQASLDSHNTRKLDQVLADLAQRIGVRLVPGFTERVIFRELFLAGLTIMDLKDAVGPQALSPSHRAARREVLDVVAAIGLPSPAAGAAPARARPRT
jgi:chromosome partitioning protein